MSGLSNNKMQAGSVGDRILAGRAVLKMTLIAASGILFNFYPEKIGIYVSLADPAGFTPLLAPGFRVHMLWLNLWWGLTFGLCAVNLVLRRWNAITRWIDFGLSALSVIIIAWLVLGGTISHIPTASLLIKLALTALIIPSFIGTINKLSALLAGEPLTAPLGQMYTRR